MDLTVQIAIDAPKEVVWRAITDIENAKQIISGIEEIEVLEKPEKGLVGLKWRETRTLFGKTATEIMWITEVEDNHYYKARAESHGAIYNTTLTISEQNQQTLLSMQFGATVQSFFAKLMSATLGRFFKKATEKALMQDLTDIKKAVEEKH